jgi:hypothetical protein
MIKKTLVLFIGAMLLTWCGLYGGLHGGAHAAETTDNKSQLTVPWDEFKRLLHLDEDQIVLPWDTFQKLLAQTGTTTTPAYTLKEGNVVLTRAEFQKLVDQMKPPADLNTQLPFDYLITKAVYSGKMGRDDTAFTGTFTVHVLRKGVYLKIPILHNSIALEDVQVEGEQALVVSEGGYHHVVLSKPGDYVVRAAFSLKSAVEGGPHKLDLAIQQTPITLFRLEMPVQNVDVEIPQAQQVVTTARGNATVVSAVITPGHAVSVRWRKKAAVAEKLPPKLYSETYHLVSIEDDALKINSDINYTILHSEVDSVRLAIPDDLTVLNVSGEGVGEWREVEQGGQRLIIIPFTYGIKGGVTVRVASEKPLSEQGLPNAFSGIQVLDTVRETGFVGIELNTSAEVKVTEMEGLEEVAVQKLPPALFNKSVKPLIFGFKYLKHPYSVVLDVQKHEKIAVPIAAIDSASVVTLFTEDGKVVHRLVYNIRNSSKQFLEIQLPEEADVWSVMVGTEPVESSISAEGKLLVPLIRSRSVDNRLDTFPVEVIYCLVAERFSLLGLRTSKLPEVDLLISQLMWSVYLPNDYSYIYFRSTLEKEEIIRGLNIFAGAQRQYDEKAMKEVLASGESESDAMRRDSLKKVYKGKDYGSKFRNVPMQEEQIASQFDAEIGFSGRLEGLAQQVAPAAAPRGAGGTGILPIQIQVPTGGQVYRFAKTIIKPEDPLVVSVTFTQSWLTKLIKWLIIVLILWIIYLNRRIVTRVVRWSQGKVKAINTWYKKHEKTIQKSARSPATPFVLFGLFIVFLFVSKLLTLLALFFFLVSVGYHISRYRKKRTKTRSTSRKRTQGRRTRK